MEIGWGSASPLENHYVNLIDGAKRTQSADEMQITKFSVSVYLTKLAPT
jgi:hypothetical protein